MRRWWTASHARRGVTVARQTVQVASALLVGVAVPAVLLRPLLDPALRALAGDLFSASNHHEDAAAAAWALARFVLLTTLLTTVPGVPIAGVLASLGGLLPFPQALALGVLIRHLSACLAYAVGSLLLRRFMNRPQTLARVPAMASARELVAVSPWRAAFLVRFVMAPEQVKNCLFGALEAVEFRAFFCMALLGDAQSTLFFCLLLGAAAKTPQLHPVVHTDEADAAYAHLALLGAAISLSAMALASAELRRMHRRSAVSHRPAQQQKPQTASLRDSGVERPATPGKQNRARRRAWSTARALPQDGDDALSEHDTRLRRHSYLYAFA